MLHALSTCWVRFARALVNMLKFISSSSGKQREITKIVVRMRLPFISQVFFLRRTVAPSWLKELE